MRYLANILSEVLTWCHTTIAAPTLLTATFDPPDVDLAWVDNATNNTCFLVWRSTDGTNFTLIDTIGDLENYTDTTAVIGISYWYRVQACDGEGNTSDFSNTVTTEELFTDINYGLLYNWYAVNTGLLAPAGWHVPTSAEWIALRTYLDPIGDSLINTAGREMKESGVVYWNDDLGLNTSKFNGRGAGRRTTGGIFSLIKSESVFWSSNALPSYSYVLTSGSDILSYAYHNNAYYGQSIRLIKDDTANPGLLVDYDGNIYPTETIGTQVWMAANLIVKHYNDGTAIPEVTDNAAWAALGTGAWCYYDNDSANQ